MFSRNYSTLRYPHTSKFRLNTNGTTMLAVHFRPHVEHSYGDNLECTLTFEDYLRSYKRSCSLHFRYTHVNEEEFGIKIFETSGSCSLFISEMRDEYHGGKYLNYWIRPEFKLPRFKGIPRKTTRKNKIWKLKMHW